MSAGSKHGTPPGATSRSSTKKPAGGIRLLGHTSPAARADACASVSGLSCEIAQPTLNSSLGARISLGIFKKISLVFGVRRLYSLGDFSRCHYQ